MRVREVFPLALVFDLLFLVLAASVRPECPVLGSITLQAFLGDLKHKDKVVRCKWNLSPLTQTLWTARAQAAYLVANETWLYNLCPGFSEHSLSTLFEWQVEVNASFLNRYSQLVLQPCWSRVDL